MDKQIEIPNAPEAPVHWNNSEASAWQSGWETGYGAARADLVKQIAELKAAALWVLYHHQGGLSPIGQPIRRLLGIGQWDDLTDEQMAAVKKFAMKEQPK